VSSCRPQVRSIQILVCAGADRLALVDAGTAAANHDHLADHRQSDLLRWYARPDRVRQELRPARGCPRSTPFPEGSGARGRKRLRLAISAMYRASEARARSIDSWSPLCWDAMTTKSFGSGASENSRDRP